MKANFKPVVLATVLATSALMALAQTAPAPAAGASAGPGTPPPERHAQMRERMKEHMAKRAAELKAKLKLSAEQEGSWNTYLAAMKPPAHPPMPRHEDIAKLNTPERLDKMREMHKQHDAEFDKRDEATRAFYSGLSAEQKKVFDDNTARPFDEGHRRSPR